LCCHLMGRACVPPHASSHRAPFLQPSV
jgi:hypothetical protein